MMDMMNKLRLLRPGAVAALAAGLSTLLAAQTVAPVPAPTYVLKGRIARDGSEPAAWGNASGCGFAGAASKSRCAQGDSRRTFFQQSPDNSGCPRFGCAADVSDLDSSERRRGETRRGAEEWGRAESGEFQCGHDSWAAIGLFQARSRCNGGA